MFQRNGRFIGLPFRAVLFPAIVAAVLGFSGATIQAQPATGRPLRALLITGGGFHNYPFQATALTNAVGRLAQVEWTIINEGGGGTKAQLPLYDNPNWAKGYDVV